MTIDQAKRDELRRLLSAADPAPWRFELGTGGLVGIGHVLTSEPIDKSWTTAPILCSHIFGPRDAANYSLMATAPTAISSLLDEVELLESQARNDRKFIDDQWAEIHAQRKRIDELETSYRQMAAAYDKSVAEKHVLEAELADSGQLAIARLQERIAVLEAERTKDAQAFGCPADRIANLEHELADLRESETTQATRIASLEFRLKVADAEVASLRLRVEAWATVATGIRQ